MGLAQPEPLPGFRRRFVITPGAGRIRAAVEDDYHCMAVVLHHDDDRILAIESTMERAPWTTCPGAPTVLTATFVGTRLVEAVRRGEKQANCTHLYDLVLLAAAHAGDAAALTYDIAVSDPVEGLCQAEVRRDGTVLLELAHRHDVLVSPVEAAGASLFKLREWIQALPARLQEPARLLQWATILGHGRSLPMEGQNDASRMPPTCYSFQNIRKHDAKRVGQVLDFNRGTLRPLEHLTADGFHPREA